MGAIFNLFQVHFVPLSGCPKETCSCPTQDVFPRFCELSETQQCAQCDGGTVVNCLWSDVSVV